MKRLSQMAKAMRQVEIFTLIAAVRLPEACPSSSYRKSQARRPFQRVGWAGI